MRAPNSSEELIEFHILSFEGPDPYARAGGIASRVTGLAEELARRGHGTHLWFVGDPAAPGEERRGALTLHRWCHWLCEANPLGVYQGEHDKVADYAASLPENLVATARAGALGNGGSIVVLAEEWHTARAMLRLDALLRTAGLRDRSLLLWNANNDYGFEHIDWGALRNAATLTTVSRYMRHRMWSLGVDPVVIPNGIPPEAFAEPARAHLAHAHHLFSDRLVLTKIARWDPAKRWLFAIDAVAELKRQGYRPLLLAFGGMEAHEAEVRERIHGHELRATDRGASEKDEAALLGMVSDLDGVDVAFCHFHLENAARSLLFRSVDAVLANSGHEPFGLVGLEAMAAGGIACTGNTGEEYAVDGFNSLVLQTNDPRELIAMLEWLYSEPEREQQMRNAARVSAQGFHWRNVVERALLPRLSTIQSMTSVI